MRIGELPRNDDEINDWVVCVIQKYSLVLNELWVLRYFHTLQKLYMQKTRGLDFGNSGFRPLLLFCGSCNLLFDFDVESQVFGYVANKVYLHRVRRLLSTFVSERGIDCLVCRLLDDHDLLYGCFIHLIGKECFVKAENHGYCLVLGIN